MDSALLDEMAPAGLRRWAARAMISVLASTLACGGSSGGASSGGTGGHVSTGTGGGTAVPTGGAGAGGTGGQVSAATGGRDGAAVPTTAKLQFDGSLSLYRVRP